MRCIKEFTYYIHHLIQIRVNASSCNMNTLYEYRVIPVTMTGNWSPSRCVVNNKGMFCTANFALLATNSPPSSSAFLRFTSRTRLDKGNKNTGHRCADISYHQSDAQLHSYRNNWSWCRCCRPSSQRNGSLKSRWTRASAAKLESKRVQT